MTRSNHPLHRTVLHWPPVVGGHTDCGIEHSAYEIAEELYRRGCAGAAVRALAYAVLTSCEVMRRGDQRSTVLDCALDAMTFLLLFDHDAVSDSATRSTAYQAARAVRQTYSTIDQGEGSDLLSTAHALLAESAVTALAAPARSLAAARAAYDLTRAAEVIDCGDYSESVVGALYRIASVEIGLANYWGTAPDMVRAFDVVRNRIPWRQCHAIVTEVAMIAALDAMRRGELAQALNRANEAVGHARLASQEGRQFNGITSRSLDVLSTILARLGRHLEAAESSIEAAMYRLISCP